MQTGIATGKLQTPYNSTVRSTARGLQPLESAYYETLQRGDVEAAYWRWDRL